MIVIASSDDQFSELCKASLGPSFSFYEGHIHDHHALMNLIKKHQSPITILLLDLALLGEGGINEITQLLTCRPDMHLIVFVNQVNQREEISAILFGAKAYCAKSMDFEQLPKIIQTVMQNEVWVDRLFVTRLLSEIRDISEAKHQEAQQLDHGLKNLTRRENQIAELIASGTTNRDVSELLGITERTVKAHLGSIFKKMHVKDRLQLALCLNRHHQIPQIWHGMIEEEKASKENK
jgi:DNA-binding NarL/FixJ family response regulator